MGKCQKHLIYVACWKLTTTTAVAETEPHQHSFISSYSYASAHLCHVCCASLWPRQENIEITHEARYVHSWLNKMISNSYAWWLWIESKTMLTFSHTHTNLRVHSIAHYWMVLLFEWSQLLLRDNKRIVEYIGEKVREVRERGGKRAGRMGLPFCHLSCGHCLVRKKSLTAQRGTVSATKASKILAQLITAEFIIIFIRFCQTLHLAHGNAYAYSRALSSQKYAKPWFITSNLWNNIYNWYISSKSPTNKQH